MAITTAASVQIGTRQSVTSRLSSAFLAIVMTLGYLVATLAVTGIVMTAGTSTAQARRRGRRRIRRGRRHRHGHGFYHGYYGFPFFAAPYYGFHGYRGSYCGRVSRRCRRYGGGYRRCMWHHGC